MEEEKARMDSLKKTLKDYEDIYEEFLELFNSGENYNFAEEGSPFSSLDAQVKIHLDSLKEQFPDAVDLINKYNELYLQAYMRPDQETTSTLFDSTAIKDSNKELSSYASTLEKIKDKTKDLRYAMNNMFLNTGIKRLSDEAISLGNEIHKTEDRIVKLNERIKELQYLADGKKKSQALETYTRQLEEAKEKLEELKEKQDELMHSGEGTTSNVSERISESAKAIENAERAFSKLEED